MRTSALHDHTFLGITQSLCPECVRLVPAKILARSGRVYFRKQCPVHGFREDFVCGDVNWFDRLEFNSPGRIPVKFAIEPDRGCPYDCGLCTEHEQHTCVAVLEITDACNLSCPFCYAESLPGRRHLPLEDCRRAIDHAVAAEGRVEVLQLSGGEPTIHPDFIQLLDYACEQPIDIVMINTNGIRIAQDSQLRDAIAERRTRCQVYLQCDGLRENIYGVLRGVSLLETKLRAIELLGQMEVFTTLVCTLEADLNLDQVGLLIEFGLSRPWISGISFQPAAYVGRFVLPEKLERRVTFPDVLQAAENQTGGTWSSADFLPLPCAHPNNHTLSYAFREGGRAIPVSRFMDLASHLDLLANGISFSRASARSLIAEFLERQTCGTDCGCGPSVAPWEVPISAPIPSPTKLFQLEPSNSLPTQQAAESFFRRAMAKELSSADVFRLTTTSFMDPYNFDLRQLMKSCVHHVLPSGHIIPFCAYNNLYRRGHVPLPELAR